MTFEGHKGLIPCIESLIKRLKAIQKTNPELDLEEDIKLAQKAIKDYSIGAIDAEEDEFCKCDSCYGCSSLPASEECFEEPEELEEPEDEIPVNLQACFQSLETLLSKEQISRFMEMEEEQMLGMCHFGFGMAIRNRWKLWGESTLKEWFNDIGIHHPDDMSSIILTSFHRFLNGKDIDVNSQVKYYQQYWEKERQKGEHNEN